MREAIERQLQRLDFDVHTASDAESALSQLRAIDPGVVLTDVRMPGLGGLDLLVLLRERSDVAVIVMTAYQDMHTAVAAMKAGAYDYLVKPLDLDLLEIILGRCFEDRSARRQAARTKTDETADAESLALESLIGRDKRMIEIYKTIGSVAGSKVTVLIRGETGTGKELIARSIHSNSDHRDEPFVAVNCTALPETLLESELFGHVRGAFTGASTDRRGRFEIAGRGTIFLDEIGDTSSAFQSKLLRVLQQKEFFPVGGERLRKTEARVLAATHRPLEQLVKAGQFREDLYFRLRVIEIVVPPLRDRPDDVLVLAEYFLRKASKDLHVRQMTLSPEAAGKLRDYRWPGNVRELENVITRAVVLARGPQITEDLLSLETAQSTTAEVEPITEMSLASAENAHITRILAKAKGNKRLTARMLKISRSRLERLLEKHGVVGPE